MTEDGDYFVLSTGRRFYAYGCVLGLARDGHGRLRPVGGYDDDAHLPYDDDGEVPSFTPAERQEIADEMIARWKRWAESGK